MCRRVAGSPKCHCSKGIALLLADGLSHAQIAQQLAISHHTAIAHGRRIYEKLDVHNRAGLVKAAGVVSLPY